MKMIKNLLPTTHILVNSILYLSPWEAARQQRLLRGRTSPLTSHERQFRTSPTTRQANVQHRLIWAVDWHIVQSGQYAVVDPHEPSSILYLTKKEYLKLIAVADSNDQVITVLATPYTARPAEDRILAPREDEITPPARKLFRVGHAIFWRGMRSRLSRSYHAFLDPDRKTFSSAKLKTHLAGLVKRWSMTLGHWASFPKSAQGWWSDILHVLPHMQSVLKEQGTHGLVLRLKHSYLLISQYIAGTPQTSHTYGHPVSLAHGLPRWLPVHARHAIRQGSTRTIRFWLSLLYIYKVLEMPYTAKKALTAIATPALVLTELQQALLDRYRAFLRDKWIPSIGGTRDIPIDKMKMFTPVSAGPNGAPAINQCGEDATALYFEERLAREENRPSILERIGELGKIFKILGGTDLSMEIRALGSNNRTRMQEIYDKERGQNQFPPSPKIKLPEEMLHSKVRIFPESAGKVRAVAIMDIFTQRVLRPLHDDLFKVLKSIPQDGTYGQHTLMSWLKNQWNTVWKGYLWSSLDISSATDSIPIVLYQVLLEELYGGSEKAKKMASTVINLMTDRDFFISGDKKVEIPEEVLELVKPAGRKPGWIRYTRGQPMGCLSSFALLGLWNHSFVQFAAYLVTGGLLGSYGVCGDDVVIAEPGKVNRIGSKYLELCNSFLIPISASKSFVSGNLFNFLSRTVLGGIEVSPASLKEEFSIRDSAGRANRTIKMLDRDWWSASDNGWLSKAVKMFLYPSEYLAFTSDASRGKLNGYGMRAVLALLSTVNSNARALGISRLPIFSLVSAFAGSTTLLARGELVRQNLLVPKGESSQSLYILLKDFAQLLLDEIIRSCRTTAIGNSYYETFCRAQKWTLKSVPLNYLFLPYSIPQQTGYQIHWWMADVKIGDYVQELNQWLGNRWWAEENIQGAIAKMLEELSQAPPSLNFTKVNLFEEQASIHYRKKANMEDDLTLSDRRMMGLLFRVALLYPGVIDFDINARFADYLERRMIHLFSTGTV